MAIERSRTKTVRSAAGAASAPGASTIASSKLSPARIVAHARAIIDAEGIASLSARRLGRGLGVRAMALYWYFDDMDAIVAAVASDLAREVVLSRERRLPLVQIASAYGTRVLDLASAHPRAFDIVRAHASRAAARREWLDAFRAIAGEGGSGERIDRAAPALFFAAAWGLGDAVARATLAGEPAAEEERAAAGRALDLASTLLFAERNTTKPRG